MRKTVVSLIVLGLLGTPTLAHAGVVCKLQEKLGVENVKECEDYWP